MSSVEVIRRHMGHDVTCERCGLIAIEFIDYVKSLLDNRPTLYNRNKCWCTFPTEFSCNDCKEKFSTP
ncbi:MAG: hypothetical protein ACRD3Z_03185 [Nitrososphaerales archaeon]